MNTRWWRGKLWLRFPWYKSAGLTLLPAPSHTYWDLVQHSKWYKPTRTQTQTHKNTNTDCCSNWLIATITRVHLRVHRHTLYAQVGEPQEETFQRQRRRWWYCSRWQRWWRQIFCWWRWGVEQNHWLGRRVGSFSKFWKSCKNWQMLKNVAKSDKCSSWN